MAEVTFCGWLNCRRNTKGLTQADLASQIQCSITFLNKIKKRLPLRQILEQHAFCLPYPLLFSLPAIAKFGDAMALDDVLDLTLKFAEEIE